ncbi:hypothetical protein EFK50_19120 [Nocardioides marmoriginsengisoli]|uniref:Uncharacterized protein n=1 Tax=Nocardioides marmoriginsengisoli TaxID=661483 RepID=A0A3N0CAF5_9ACTN|nr:hypothetical protein [Nocardioides marmoriginsengisoli]RNL60444.1 hypothetical protein EFK50_19120 [Nocardioides marmoriginsengisoli]
MVTLTPQARAIAAFTLAVLLLLGSLNRISVTFIALFGDSFPMGRGGAFLAGMVATLVAGAVLALAMAAANGLTSGWELSLAQTARVLALIGFVLAVVNLVTAVAHQIPYGFYGIPGTIG